jgi:hypothetical protein
VSSPALYRSAAVLGVLTGVWLLFNDARRVGLVPDTDLTTALAPIASATALLALVGLYLAQRERAGWPGALGFAALLVGIAGLLTVEFVTHYLFRGLDPATVAGLLTPRVRAGFLTIAVLFAVGTVLFTVAGFRSGRYPRWALALFAVGFLLAASRGFTPEWVISLGFLLGPVGLIGLSVALHGHYRAEGHQGPQAGEGSGVPRASGSRSRGSGVGVQRPSTTA